MVRCSGARSGTKIVSTLGGLWQGWGGQVSKARVHCRLNAITMDCPGTVHQNGGKRKVAIVSAYPQRGTCVHCLAETIPKERRRGVEEKWKRVWKTLLTVMAHCVAVTAALFGFSEC